MKILLGTGLDSVFIAISLGILERKIVFPTLNCIYFPNLGSQRESLHHTDQRKQLCNLHWRKGGENFASVIMIKGSDCRREVKRLIQK